MHCGLKIKWIMTREGVNTVSGIIALIVIFIAMVKVAIQNAGDTEVLEHGRAARTRSQAGNSASPEKAIARRPTSTSIGTSPIKDFFRVITAAPKGSQLDGCGARPI
jgi:hypothetical protein